MRGLWAWYMVAGFATAYAATSLALPELRPSLSLLRPQSSRAEPVSATFTNAFLFVRILSHPDGTRDVQFENFFAKDPTKFLRFSTMDTGEILRHGNLEIDLRFGPEVVIVRLEDRTAALDRFERGRAQEAWRAHCARASEGLAAFQEGFDAWALQKPELMWWGLAAFMPAARRASPLLSSAQPRLVGPGLPCPALKEAWAAGAFAALSRSEGCLLSRGCSFYGRCSEVGGQCVATADSCRRSMACRKSGACTLGAGYCVVGANDCATSHACEWSGRCVKAAGFDACVAGSELDCASSFRCATENACFHDGDACVARPDANRD